MRLGYISQNTPRDVPPARLAAELEARGFESLWVGEHPQIPVAARDSPLAPMLGPLKRKYDPLIVLAVAAEATSRLVVGTAVALPLEHELFTFAKQVATVDQLSGGRLVLGVGVGLRVEFEVATRRPWADRYRLLGEMVAAMQVLWADDEPEFHGEFFDFEPVWSYPKPHRTPHPPLLASAIGPHGVRASLPWADGWIPGDTSVPDIAVALIEFRRAAEDAGRDPATLDLTVLAWGDPTVATLERYRELGFGRAVVGAGRQSAADIDSTWAFLDTYAPLLDA